MNSYPKPKSKRLVTYVEQWIRSHNPQLPYVVTGAVRSLALDLEHDGFGYAGSQHREKIKLTKYLPVEEI